MTKLVCEHEKGFLENVAAEKQHKCKHKTAICKKKYLSDPEGNLNNYPVFCFMSVDVCPNWITT